MKEVHCSVLVKLQQVHLLKYQDRVHPGGEVAQEGVEPTAGPTLLEKRSTVLPCDTEPCQQCPHKIVGELASHKHLPHQQRQLRGVGIKHDSPKAGVRRMAASKSLTRPVPG